MSVRYLGGVIGLALVCEAFLLGYFVWYVWSAYVADGPTSVREAPDVGPRTQQLISAFEPT